MRSRLHAEFSLRNGSPEATVVAARGEIDAFTATSFAEKLSVAAENAQGFPAH